ncbi:hypothetical protein RIF29_08227 [Crotalaria pallida]|uniref:Ribosomal protein L1 n=1 Tax=Crotalaria pallida TaxID=3830 RepID=A0AAN9PBV3_CROPI
MAAVIVTPETVEQAIDSLLKWCTSQSQSQKPKLFHQDDEFVYLVLTLKKIPPRGRVNPHKLPLPHSLFSQFSERCLIIDDRPKSNLTKSHAQERIQSENIPISKVLKLSKLASDYRAFEAKRKLCNSYDMFFADKRIVPLLPRLLGKQFFKKKKIPVVLDLRKANWKEQVEKSCSAGLFRLGTGTCSVVRVAKLSMERDDIVENVVAAIGGVVEIIPKNWGNVRSFHVKLLESVALPIYQAVPDIKLRIEGSKAEEEEEAERKMKEESEKEESDRKAGKKKKKKGRIHEVKYMDDKVGEDVVKEKSGGEDGDDDDNDDVQDAAADDSADIDEKLGQELVNKKRKKGTKVENGAFGDLGNEKKKMKKSAQESGKKKKKDGKENLIKQSKSEDEESGEKEKKKKQSRSEAEESGKKEKKKKQNRSEDEESGKKQKKGVDVKAKVKKSKKAA